MSRSPPTDEALVQSNLAQLDGLPFSLLDEPLDFIFADHFRQRSLCAVLRSFAQSRKVPRASAEKVVAFLTDDLALHHEDEDTDLFLALREHAVPEDGLSPILAGLSEDHRQASLLVAGIIAELTVNPTRDHIAISAAAAEKMLAYVAAEQRHLSVENGIVLVIARKRLSPGDLRRLSRSMKTRRGLETQ